MILWCKMTFFKWAWHKEKVMPCPLASRSTLTLIRPLKWDTWRLWTPSGSKNTSHQSWMIKKTVRFSTKWTVFLIVQLWRMVFLEPLEVNRRYVSHFKGLISAKVDLEVQGNGITFTLCHVLLKKAILHHKIVFFWFVFSTTTLLVFLSNSPVA